MYPLPVIFILIRQDFCKTSYMATYLGNFLLHSLPVMFVFQPCRPSCPGALAGAPRSANAVGIPPSLSSLLLELHRFALPFLFLRQFPQLSVMLLFESSYFLDVLVVESFPQRLQLCRQACRPDGPAQLRGSLRQLHLTQQLLRGRRGGRNGKVQVTEWKLMWQITVAVVRWNKSSSRLILK